jgi:carboxylate-amine ligase
MLFADRGGALAPGLGGADLADDPSTDIEHEFKLEQAEIASVPTGDLAALMTDLADRRRELVSAAAERGLRVAALGTSPLRGDPTPTPDARYRRMQDHFALVAADQLTCGMHVHVSVGSRAEGVTAIDAIRGWLPVLLAISTNSPFWDGRDSGYASYRSVSWGRWPTAGATAAFGDEAGYDAAVARLITAGAALDDGMIYFDARLSAKYPTVEIRVADVVQRIADSALVAALARALVQSSLDGRLGELGMLPDAALVRAASWRAARFGLAGDLIDPDDGRPRAAPDLLDRLLDLLGPALRSTGDSAAVLDTVGRLLREGTGADVQRADLARTGSVRDVIDAAVRRTAEL